MTPSSNIGYSPGMLSLLPMFYVGWADSVLSPSEMELIHAKVNNLNFITEEEKALLISWTNPKNPPSQKIFKQWITAIKVAGGKMNLDQKENLVEVGLEMAKSGIGYRDEEIWKSPATQKAIEDIYTSLGLKDRRSLRLLHNKMESADPINDNTEGSFDNSGLMELLEEPYGEVRRRMRKLLRDPAFKLEHIRDKEAYRERVLDWAMRLAKQGLGSYAYPKEYGGKADSGSHITVFEMLGYHDLSLAVKFGVQFGLFGGAIYNLGTKTHHEKYLSGLGSGDILGCFAMTETGHGSNVKGLETTATYNHANRSIIIHSPNRAAGKEYIGNALHCSCAAVFAQLIVDGESHGVHAVVVPIRDGQGNLLPGVEVEDCGYKMGLNGIDNGRIWFDEVEVPVENLLNRFGDINEEGQYHSPIKNGSRRFFIMLGTLVAGRVCVGLAGNSATKKALLIAVKYGLKRRQFSPKGGEPETLLLDYPSHQRRLMPRIAKTYALDFAMKSLLNNYTASLDKEDKRAVEAEAAGLKACSTWHATSTIQECREACGGKGYLAENQFADLKNDTDVFTTFEGDNTVLYQLVAKGLLSNLQKEFHDEGYRAVMRYLAGKITTRISEKNFINIRRTDTEHLLDPDFYYDAFTFREEKILDSVSGRMRKYIAQRVHPSDAFLRCQTHMIALAQAHVDVLLLKGLYKAIHKAKYAETRSMVESLYRLFALSTIEENKGWFLENDYMAGNKTKAIRRLVDKLCADLREEADALVNAFGIPEELIVAPIVV